MSEDSGQSIHDQIIAELSAGQAAQAEPVAAAPANLETEETTETAVEAPPVQSEVPRSFKAKVGGEEIDVPLFDEGGAINPKLIEFAQKAQDYTRKMQQVAAERRAYEQEKFAWQAERLKEQQGALPALPDDDPYAQHAVASQKRLDAVEQYLAYAAEQQKEEAEQRELAISQEALKAKQAQLAADFKLDEDEVERVTHEFYLRHKKDETITLDAVAKARREKLDAIEARAVMAWKEKHRVGSAAGGGSSPATGTAPPVLTPKSPGFMEAFISELTGVTG